MRKKRLHIPSLSFDVRINWNPILTIALYVFAILTLYLIVDEILRIRKIEVYGDNIQLVLKPEYIPRNMIFFPSDKFKADILRSNTLLKNVTITKKYPDTLEISVTTRRPYAILVTPNEELYLSDDALVLGPAVNQTLQLPKIRITDQAVDPRVPVMARKLKSSIQWIEHTDSWINLSEVWIDSTDNISLHTAKTEIRVTTASNVVSLASTLQILYSRFRMENNVPSLIDLRYGKPVISYP